MREGRTDYHNLERSHVTNYRIIQDEWILNPFLDTLPPLEKHEVWYLVLMGRHKYDPNFPNSGDAGQLARVTARDASEIKEKLRRMESPIGSYTRDGTIASQQCLGTYITMNPRSLIKANRMLLVDVATRISESQFDFNPISLATTCIHRAVDRKFVVDFDFDGSDVDSMLPKIREILPHTDMYRILLTRGGFHLLVNLENVRLRVLKNQWHQAISKLPGCDIRGSDTLTPIPGCTQGGFIPRFIAQ